MNWIIEQATETMPRGLTLGLTGWHMPPPVLEGFERYGLPGWDGEDADPVPAWLIAYARDFLVRLPTMLVPAVAPGADGSIGFVWERDDIYVYVDLLPSREAQYYFALPNQPEQDDKLPLADPRLLEITSAALHQAELMILSGMLTQDFGQGAAQNLDIWLAVPATSTPRDTDLDAIIVDDPIGPPPLPSGVLAQLAR